MPRTILGIAVAHNEATVVHLQGGWKGATVIHVERVALPADSAEGRRAALLAADLPRADTVIAGLGADRAFHRLVELPFSERAKVERAAPLQAEESLPLPLEQLVCDVQMLSKTGSGSRAFLAAAPLDAVAGLVHELDEGGLQPQGVDVSALALTAVIRHCVGAEEWAAALDLGDDLAQAVLLGPDGPQTFHALSNTAGDEAIFAEMVGVLGAWNEQFSPPAALYLSGTAALEQNLEQWCDQLGLPVAVLPLPTDTVAVQSDSEVSWPAWAIPLGLALKEGYAKKASAINLLQGPFAPAREHGPWRRAAITAGAYATLLLMLWGGGMWSRAAHKEAQYNALKNAIRETFRQALPDTPIRVELSQMRTKVSELEERAESLGSLVDREVSPLNILREISARIPESLEVEFRDLTVDGARVRIEGSTTSFDAIDKIKADLAKHPRFHSVSVSDAKAGVERDKVLFKMTISLNQEG